MCLIVFAWHAHPDYPLILAGNRDEFYSRRTRPAAWWGQAVSLLAGQDEEAGGTWFGITRRGRLAALTNVRAPSRTQSARAVAWRPGAGRAADAGAHRSAGSNGNPSERRCSTASICWPATSCRPRASRPAHCTTTAIASTRRRGRSSPVSTDCRTPSSTRPGRKSRARSRSSPARSPTASASRTCST